MNLITYAVPFFLAAIALELVWGLRSRNNTYRLNDTFSSLMLGILSQARRFVALGVGGWVYHQITLATGGALWSTQHWATWLVAFVFYDFCYYWLHRMGHERQILWAAHVAHHQSEDYNLGTALRQTSSGFLFGWIFYIPMYALGIPAEVVVTVGSLNLIYQFWVHTQHVGELGWLEYILVSPSNHRVHHAQNDCYLDRNYGGVFILWDRLFGTYQRELPEEPCIYGIRGPIHSWNPLVALTHIYADMINDMRRTHRWRDRWQVLWARTGWQPDDVRATWPREKSDLNTFERYDPPTTAASRFYGGLQIAGGTALLMFGQFNSLSNGAYWLWWALLVATGVAAAWWLEGKSTLRCWLVEGPRLAVLAGFLAGPHVTGAWAMMGVVWVSASFVLAVLMSFATAPALTSSEQPTS